MDSDPHLVPTILASLVVLASAAWVAMSHIRSRPRRPRTGPPTMELGDDPPAVVDLLTDDFSVTPAAVPATVVDLAARRWLSIDEIGGGEVVIRLAGRDRPDPLRPYERRVLDHLRGLAVDETVPAEAMTTGTEGASKSWWRAFRREVIADAQARGLCRDRWTPAALAPVWVGVVASAGLLWLADTLGRPEGRLDLSGAIWGAALLSTLGLVAFAATAVSRGLQRDTDEGLAAASYWLGVRDHLTTGDFGRKPAAMVALWDRHLAHAVALDLAPLVVAQLPLGAEDHRHAWSRATGRWRPVTVRYPRLRPGYGQHPAWAAVGALAVGVVAAATLRFAIRVSQGEVSALADSSGDVTRGIDVTALVMGAAALAVLAWNLVKLALAVGDLVGTDRCEGIVVRRRVRRGWFRLSDRPSPSSDDRSKDRYFCALDTGTDEVVTAWRVRRDVYAQLSQGERCRVEVTPRLRYVRRVEPMVSPAAANRQELGR